MSLEVGETAAVENPVAHGADGKPLGCSVDRQGLRNTRLAAVEVLGSHMAGYSPGRSLEVRAVVLAAQGRGGFAAGCHHHMAAVVVAAAAAFLLVLHRMAGAASLAGVRKSQGCRLVVARDYMAVAARDYMTVIARGYMIVVERDCMIAVGGSFGRKDSADVVDMRVVSGLHFDHNFAAGAEAADIEYVWCRWVGTKSAVPLRCILLRVCYVVNSQNFLLAIDIYR